MPLSDREKELLAEMERAMVVDDPRLVSTLTGSPRKLQKKRTLLGASLVVLGLVVLLTGLVSQTIPLGIVGFLISLVGVILAISGASTPTTGNPRKSGGQPRKPKGKWSTRMEERWDRRNEN